MLTVPRLKGITAILSENRTLANVLECAAKTLPPQPWYLIGGSLYQTVWNVKHGKQPERHIDDYDIAYFDPHTRKRQEAKYQRQISEWVPGVKVQVKNQALITPAWFKRHFGCKKDTPRYLSLEDAIGKAYVSSPVLGVSWRDGELQVLDLADSDRLLDQQVFPNNKFRGRKILPFYRKKYAKWHALWPKVRFYNWDGQLVKREEDI
jgi:hypothetical protein